MASGDTKTEALMNALENGGDISNIVGCCNTNLQNYIIGSIGSLDSAKQIIEQKGGTVGDTGLSGLAEEVASIPSGGSGDWGTVTYLDDNNEEQTGTMRNISEYSSLGYYRGSDQWRKAIIDGVEVPIAKITGVNLGKSATFTPYHFLDSANALTSLTGTSNLIYIGEGFLYACRTFNQAISVPSATFIGADFLEYCYAFNQPVTLPSAVTTLGRNFMRSCSVFNQPIDLSNIEIVGNYFMGSNTAFNQPLNLSKAKGIGSYFLDSCSAFNQPIDLSSVETIDSYFMQGCSAYAQTLTIPSSTTSVGSYFMYNCNSFTGNLVCEGPSLTSELYQSNQTLATTSSTAAIYATGVTLTGSKATLWKNRLSNRNSSPYRKLIVGS